MKGWCHTHNILLKVGMPISASYVLRTHNIIDYVARSKIRSNVRIAITWTVFNVQPGHGHKYCHDLWLNGHLLKHSSFGFSFVRGRKSKPFSGFFKIHDLHMIPSIWLQIWNLEGKLCKMKPFGPSVTSHRDWIFISRDSEVIFSHSVFVCLFVCLFFCVCMVVCMCLSRCWVQAQN